MWVLWFHNSGRYTSPWIAFSRDRRRCSPFKISTTGAQLWQGKLYWFPYAAIGRSRSGTICFIPRYYQFFDTYFNWIQYINKCWYFQAFTAFHSNWDYLWVFHQPFLDDMGGFNIIVRQRYASHRAWFTKIIKYSLLWIQLIWIWSNQF